MQGVTIETDYLVIGSGAVGMAFVDALVTESDAKVVMVDRHHRPGGHWNDAYPFVRLHSPAAYYGVASTPLGSGRIEETGDNAGLFDLASGREIVAYYDRVLEEKLLATGRVRYLPMTEHRGAGELVSLVSGLKTTVRYRKKLVDATHTRTEVPSTRKPQYAIADGMRCVPINDLVRIEAPHRRYVVIGGGKTGIDACLWLLNRGVAPDDIRWIRPRDAWLHNRARVQPGTFGPVLLQGAANQMEAATQASSIDDLFIRLEDREEFLRIDRSVTPTMFRGATVSERELAKLRSIEDVVRLGRVLRIETDRILLEQGSVATHCDNLHIDCSANGLAHAESAGPVFQPGLIVSQSIRYLNAGLSAALIGYLEATRSDNIARNNALCRPLSHPAVPRDWARVMVGQAQNVSAALQDRDFRSWETRCRLNPTHGAPGKEDGPSPEWEQARRRYRDGLGAGIAQLQRLLQAAQR